MVWEGAGMIEWLTGTVDVPQWGYITWWMMFGYTVAKLQATFREARR